MASRSVRMQGVRGDMIAQRPGRWKMSGREQAGPGGPACLDQGARSGDRHVLDVDLHAALWEVDGDGAEVIDDDVHNAAALVAEVGVNGAESHESAPGRLSPGDVRIGVLGELAIADIEDQNVA